MRQTTLQKIRLITHGPARTGLLWLCCAVVVIGCLYVTFSLAGVWGADRPAADRGADPQAEVVPVRAEVADDLKLFSQVQAVFEDNCYACHGPRRQNSGLRMDLRTNVFRGGDSAEPGIVPGQSEASYIYKSITGADGVNRMPIEGPPLSDEEIALVKQWIDSGAPWPQQEGEEDPAAEPRQWSLEPVVDPQVPSVRSDAWCQNDIDAFILQALQREGLNPTPEADRRKLIRRVFFTLHGLVPTPEQMRQYTSDESDDWYPNMVEDLLASPRYGERWARHWLDLVRYADTNGFETNTPRPDAYRYRDYVIRAFNEDKPYDQFILDQLAGDTTGEGAATGFLVAGPKDIVGSPDPVLTAMQRSDELADIVNVTSTAFMGLTVACARCHHHKFDPIEHADYYAMEAVFAGVQHGERELSPASSSEKSEDDWKQLRELAAEIDTYQPLASVNHDTEPTRPAVSAKRNVERFEPVNARFVRMVMYKTVGGLEPCIDEFEIYPPASSEQGSVNLALASAGGVPSSSGNIGGNHRLSYINDGLFGNHSSTIVKWDGEKHWVQIELGEEHIIDRVVWGRDRTEGYADRLAVDYRIEVATEPGQWQTVADSSDRFLPKDAQSYVLPDDKAAQLRQLQQDIQTLEAKFQPVKAYAGTFHQPGPTHRLYRGDPMAKREVVAPGTISVLPSLGLDVDAPEHERRVALAKSFADPDHPLTARVMVNRIWQHHMGQGLVNTPSDFGAMGATPTHPELLDYLASRFVQGGWSIKQMHRLILNSSTFRQDSIPNDAALRIDADATLLWRFPPRRHEAEVIRDSMLRVTGVLDLSMYGPGFSFFDVDPNYVRVYNQKDTFGPEDWRRMIYGSHIRMERDQTFGGFDCPDAGQPTPMRTRSTTALQALSLFNSPFVLQQAEIFAQRLRESAGDDLKQQVDFAFMLLYSREPDAFEMKACLDYIEEQGLIALCRVLLNTNAFLFVE